ncbi:MAG: hypothetical protein V4582_24080 [Pseudomonadota bacterium]
MDSARDKPTGQIVDAEQLWIIDPVEPEGYECRGCGAAATPCSYRPENKVRPYFAAKSGHHTGCDVEGEEELVKRAKKQRVTARDGFPGSAPNRLELVDARAVAGPGGAPGAAPGGGGGRLADGGENETRRHRAWAAQTIRPICRTFIKFPFDRDLPLAIPGIDAATYQRVFKVLKSNEIMQYPERRLFYAPISWKAPSGHDDHLEILLSYGEWVDGKLVRPYRVKLDWSAWSAAKRRNVSNEIEVAQDEYMKAKKAGKIDKGYLFFIGKQDEGDPALFHVDDHRLICCLVAEMIYPKWPSSSQ